MPLGAGLPAARRRRLRALRSSQTPPAHPRAIYQRARRRMMGGSGVEGGLSLVRLPPSILPSVWTWQEEARLESPGEKVRQSRVRAISLAASLHRRRTLGMSDQNAKVGWRGMRAKSVQWWAASIGGPEGPPLPLGPLIKTGRIRDHDRGVTRRLPDAGTGARGSGCTSPSEDLRVRSGEVLVGSCWCQFSIKPTRTSPVPGPPASDLGVIPGPPSHPGLG